MLQLPVCMLALLARGRSLPDILKSLMVNKNIGLYSKGFPRVIQDEESFCMKKRQRAHETDIVIQRE